MRLEHLGIAVADLAAAKHLYTKLLNTPPYKEETVESQQVTTLFFQTGDSKIELLGTTHADGPIGRHIARRGAGIHHVAFEVDDIRAEMRRLREQGFELLSAEPSIGADDKLVCFVDPKSANGVLVELCQSRR